jgi:hypothetical protein
MGSEILCSWFLLRLLLQRQIPRRLQPIKSFSVLHLILFQLPLICVLHLVVVLVIVWALSDFRVTAAVVITAVVINGLCIPVVPTALRCSRGLVGPATALFFWLSPGPPRVLHVLNRALVVGYVLLSVVCCMASCCTPLISLCI